MRSVVVLLVRIRAYALCHRDIVDPMPWSKSMGTLEMPSPVRLPLHLRTFLTRGRAAQFAQSPCVLGLYAYSIYMRQYETGSARTVVTQKVASQRAR